MQCSQNFRSLHAACAASCCRRERQQAISREHNEDWSSASTKLKEGVAELCLYNVARLQAALALTAATYAFAKWLLEHIGSQRKQHARLQRHKDSLYNKMKAAVQELLEWVPQLNFHSSSLRGDQDVQAMLASTGVTANATGALNAWAYFMLCRAWCGRCACSSCTVAVIVRVWQKSAAC